jgi:hypothetical protein
MTVHPLFDGPRGGKPLFCGFANSITPYGDVVLEPLTFDGNSNAYLGG